jgi:hypothetical protein
VIGVIGTAGLALIAKVGSDALSGAAEPGGKNFADNWLASVRNHTAAAHRRSRASARMPVVRYRPGSKTRWPSHAASGSRSAKDWGCALTAQRSPNAQASASTPTQPQPRRPALAKQQAQAYHDEVNRNKNSLSMWEITRDKQVADTKAWRELWDKSAQSITGDMVGTLKGAKKDVSRRWTT